MQSYLFFLNSLFKAHFGQELLESHGGFLFFFFFSFSAREHEQCLKHVSFIKFARGYVPGPQKSGSVFTVNWPFDSSVVERQVVWDYPVTSQHNRFKMADDEYCFYVLWEGSTSHPSLCYAYYKSRGFNFKSGQEGKLTSAIAKLS